MEDQHKMTMRIPEELHRHAKAKAALMGKPLSSVVRELLEKWLEEKPLYTQTEQKDRPSER